MRSGAAKITFEIAPDQTHWGVEIAGKVKAWAKALFGPTSSPGKYPRLMYAADSETGPGPQLVTWGKSTILSVDAYGFKVRIHVELGQADPVRLDESRLIAPVAQQGDASNDSTHHGPRQYGPNGRSPAHLRPLGWCRRIPLMRRLRTLFGLETGATHSLRRFAYSAWALHLGGPAHSTAQKANMKSRDLIKSRRTRLSAGPCRLPPWAGAVRPEL